MSLTKANQGLRGDCKSWSSDFNQLVFRWMRIGDRLIQAKGEVYALAVQRSAGLLSVGREMKRSLIHGTRLQPRVLNI